MEPESRARLDPACAGRGRPEPQTSKAKGLGAQESRHPRSTLGSESLNTGPGWKSPGQGKAGLSPQTLGPEPKALQQAGLWLPGSCPQALATQPHAACGSLSLLCNILKQQLPKAFQIITGQAVSIVFMPSRLVCSFLSMRDHMLEDIGKSPAFCVRRGYRGKRLSDAEEEQLAGAETSLLPGSDLQLEGLMTQHSEPRSPLHTDTPN